MAQTLPQAMKKGDVKAERNGKTSRYVFSKLENRLSASEVDRWRKVAEIPAKQRSEYYASEKRPTRSGILRWWDGKTVNAEPVVQSHDAGRAGPAGLPRSNDATGVRTSWDIKIMGFFFTVDLVETIPIECSQQTSLRKLPLPARCFQ